jgi:hypothetical protein
LIRFVNKKDRLRLSNIIVRFAFLHGKHTHIGAQNRIESIIHNIFTGKALKSITSIIGGSKSLHYNK